MQKPVALAADHGGFELKNHIKEHLTAKGIAFVDFGVNSPDSVDYADVVRPAVDAVLKDECASALLFCGTGVGISIAANKFHGIRACCCSDAYSAEMTRRHNNANALCMGGRVVGPGLAETLVDKFLETGFEGDRHQRRIDKISKIEEDQGR